MSLCIAGFHTYFGTVARVKKNEIINYENTHISYYKKQKLRPLHTCEVRGSVLAFIPRYF
jgi:hypothetical protein